MYEELYHLLTQLGLGPAARPLCDLIADLTGESMSVQQLQQQIRSVLHLHGGAHCADAVIAALVELGLLAVSGGERSKNQGAGAAMPGASAIDDSRLLSASEKTIVVRQRASRAIHESARGWLDIDSGIYFDVRQHAAGNDSER